MTEILFRGKRVDNGEWVYGYYFKATHHWHNHGIHEDWIAVDTIQNGGYCNVRGKYAIIPETLGQYTGLTDKNGKKIFDGDIVMVIDNVWGSPFCYGITGKIVYDECGFFIEPKNPRDTQWLYNECAIYEVIGNIHDNPELLERSNENAE